MFHLKLPLAVLLIICHQTVADMEFVGMSLAQEFYQDVVLECRVEMEKLSKVENFAVKKETQEIVNYDGQNPPQISHLQTVIFEASGDVGEAPFLKMTILEPPIEAAGEYICSANVVKKDKSKQVLTAKHKLTIRPTLSLDQVLNSISTENEELSSFVKTAIEEMKTSYDRLENLTMEAYNIMESKKFHMESGYLHCGEYYYDFPVKLKSFPTDVPGYVPPPEDRFKEIRSEDKVINFKTNFLKPPIVVTRLRSIDANVDFNIRLSHFPLEVTTTGFKGRCITWSDTKTLFAHIEWVAFSLL